MREPPSRAAELADLLTNNDWLMTVLRAVNEVEPPELWVGAGAIRDVVWDTRYGPGFDPANVKDVDVVYFDSVAPSAGAERRIEKALVDVLPTVAWDVTNEATVHEWYESKFGVAVKPYISIDEAVASWPEFATSVALRLNDKRTFDLIAPLGLDDLLDGVWRRNPTRVTVEEARVRLVRKNVAERWPGVRVLR